MFTVTVSASPARKGPIELTQPDGTSFTALLQGDEFIKIKTTLDGHAIIQDEDGWWCYAVYESDGSRYNSGWKVGKDVPAAVLSESMNIPRNSISDNALRKRLSANTSSAKQFNSTTLQDSTQTKKHGIVILAEFKDIKFVNTREDFNAMLNGKGYSRYGATGSAKDYFEDQFNNTVNFTFDVSEIITLPAKREYYGENDSKGNDMRPEYLVADACSLAVESGVDFSKYDSDNDGVVDNIFVFFAGEDEAEGAIESSIWSHSWYLFNGAGVTVELNGKLLDRYACASEMTRILNSNTGRLQETRLSGIGTFCHEYSHTLGLPDLYDTDYDDEGGWAAGLWGSTALMDSGNQNNQGNTPPNFNAIEREILGISEPILIETDGKYEISPIHQTYEIYKLATDRADEYYLIECRSDMENVWDRYIGGSGMLVYHIDKSRAMMNKWDISNTVNADANHQCADLIEADGRSDSHPNYRDYLTRREHLDGLFFPYYKSNNLTPYGTPGLKYWSGATGKISITGIERQDNGNISFNIIGFTADSTPPSVKGDIQYEAFSDGAILTFESDRPHEGEAFISYSASGKGAIEISVAPYEEGKYALMLEGLDPVRTYTVSVHFTVNGIKGTDKTMSFMTKKKPAVSWPYITMGTKKKSKGIGELMAYDYMEDNKGRFEAGSRIPFRITNTEGVKKILWFFNGQPVTHEGDYYYTLNESGTLEAHLYMENGEEYILIKEINIER